MVDEDRSFSVTVRRSGRDAVVEIAGEFDLHASEQLDGALASLASQDGTIDVDTRRVTFIDSGGLRALLVAREAARARGTVFRMTVASEHVVRVAELAGVPDLLLPDP